MDQDGKRCLLIVDYFSKNPFLFQMSSTTANGIIYHLKELFPLEEPSEFFTDNRQPFNTKEWHTFTDKYSFQHTT